MLRNTNAIKLGAVCIISIFKANGCGNNEEDLDIFLGLFSIIRISRVIKISEIAKVSASSTTKPGKIKDSAKQPRADNHNQPQENHDSKSTALRLRRCKIGRASCRERV